MNLDQQRDQQRQQQRPDGGGDAFATPQPHFTVPGLDGRDAQAVIGCCNSASWR